MPDLVIFDCDGVLVDSEPLMDRITIQMIAEQAAPSVPMAEIEALNDGFSGLFMAEMLARIEEYVGHSLPQNFEPELRRRSYELFAAEIEPIAGVGALLDRLDAASVPYCVASNGPQAKMSVMLGKVGFYDRLAGRIFSAHDPYIPKDRPKPHPDLYLHAAKEMGAPIETCIVVDDTPLGASAGVRAGIRTIGYAGNTEPAELAAIGAEPVATMAEIGDLLLGP